MDKNVQKQRKSLEEEKNPAESENGETMILTL